VVVSQQRKGDGMNEHDGKEASREDDGGSISMG
jgi:hypothetical protein